MLLDDDMASPHLPKELQVLISMLSKGVPPGKGRAFYKFHVPELTSPL